MGQWDAFRNRVEPFAALFGLSAFNVYPAGRPSITPPPYTKHGLIINMATVGSIINAKAAHPFSYLGFFI